VARASGSGRSSARCLHCRSENTFSLLQLLRIHQTRLELFKSTASRRHTTVPEREGPLLSRENARLRAFASGTCLCLYMKSCCRVVS
jgi:hypothetical protein